jgi:hypothetical protein
MAEPLDFETVENAGGGDRTHTILRSLDFESSASASSATPAIATKATPFQPIRKTKFLKRGFVSFTLCFATTWSGGDFRFNSKREAFTVCETWKALLCRDSSTGEAEFHR